MPTPTYIAVLKRYNNSTEKVKGYFDQLPDLVHGGFPYEVCLAYLFLRLEKAQNRALYCGVVKLHRANGEMADKAINSQHLTREGFLKLYSTVFGKSVPDATLKLVKKAEKIRDKVIHGKKVSDSDVRESLVDVIAYAESLNKELNAVAGFEPFGDLRGFKGRGVSLDNTTSRWLLKGLGFALV
jgi:hypothetical protein